MKKTLLIAAIMIFTISTASAQKQDKSKNAGKADTVKTIEPTKFDDGTPFPDEDSFIAVEKEPTFDMAELQKNLVYPVELHKAGIQGRVDVRTLVDKNGNVACARITDKSARPELGKAAIDAIKKLKFTPAMQNGKPVAIWIDIPIIFEIKK